jgi:hypothetical protein
VDTNRKKKVEYAPRRPTVKVPRFVASIATIVLLATHPAAAAAQKPAALQPADQQKLKERVDALESQLKEAQAKADRAAIQKDYIERVEKDTEKYYERAFETQVKFLDWIVILVAAAPLLVGLLSFRAIDRRIQDRLRHASTQLRTEFAERLANETNALQEAHAAELKVLEDDLTKRITEQEQNLKFRSDYQHYFAQALAFAAAGSHGIARDQFRRALMIYKHTRAKHLIDKLGGGAVTAENLFRTFHKEDQAKFRENAKNELADKLYNDLEEELALAALNLDWLAPLVKERKPAPN